MDRIGRLLTYGADVEKKNPDGKKPRHLINRALWYRLPNDLLGEDGEKPAAPADHSTAATSSGSKCSIE